MEIAKNGSKEF